MALLDLLLPYPGRLEFAVRLALLCALTTLVAEIYQTPEPALTAYVAFFLIKPDRTTSVIQSIIMLLLITLVVGTVILVTMVVIDAPLWRVTAMAAISFCLLFAGSASKLKPVAAIVALIAAYALDLLGTAHIGEVATRALLYAWLFVGIPAGVSLAVNLLLGPAPRCLVERALAERLHLCATMLRGPDTRSRSAFQACLHEGPGGIPAWLKVAGAEKTSSPQEIAALRQAAASTTAILLLVKLISDDPERLLPRPLRERAAQLLDEMAAILRAGGYPVEVTFDMNDATPTLPPLPAAVLVEFREALAHFADTPGAEPATKPATKPRGGFFLPDAFTNAAHVHYALKTTAAAMFCYVVYSLLDWPGIHTCLITCYIVSLGTAAETIEKLTLRILGCLVGAAAGLAAIVFLMPDVTSIGVLIAVVFVAALVSAWIAAGSPRIAYVGFQLAFAFFLSVVQGSAPAFDMTVARDRVIGILFGNLVVALVFTLVWPVSVAKRIDPAIAALLRQFSAMAIAGNRPRRCALATEAQAALGGIEQDLDLTRYEPSSIRPTQSWLEARHAALQAIAALEGPLLLSANQDPGLPRDIARRLDWLVDHLDANPGPSPAINNEEIPSHHPSRQEAPSVTPYVMGEFIDAHLAQIEEALTRSHHGMNVGDSHAPA